MKTRLASGIPLLVAVSLAVAIFFVLPPLGASGLWEDRAHGELDAAEIARRYALHTFGADGLAIEGGDNGPVDLASASKGPSAGPLPYAAMAIGFKLFGLHDWAGRLPLALLALAGVLATFAFVARMVDRRAAAYAAIALATMPLYFVQARTMMGGAVAMSGVAMAFGGAVVAVFGGGRLVGRLGWIALAAVGVAIGWASAGAWLGAGVPLVAVAGAWMVARASGAQKGDRAGDGLGLVCAAVGVAAIVLGARALAAVEAPPRAASFDLVLGRLGHALAPWSAFLPFALGRLFVTPPDGAERDRESGLRVALVVGAAIALFAHGWLATSGADATFVAPALLAAACAVALRDYERGAHPSLAVGGGTAVLLAILVRDFKALPDKVLEPLAASDSAHLPDTFRHESLVLFGAALGVFGVVAAFAWAGDRDGAPFSRARYARSFRATADAWNGLALRGYLVFVALGGAGTITLWAGARAHAKWAAAVSTQLRELLAVGFWVVALAPLVVLVALPLAYDASVWVSRRIFRGQRGALVVTAGAVAGAVLAFGHYPALAAQLSPKGAFDAYASVHRKGEPLALLGVTSRAAAYYAGATPTTFNDPKSALEWLTDDSTPARRFIVVSDDRLAPLNQLYRERTGENLPVLDARSSHVLLAASRLVAGETSASPFDAFTLHAAPAPDHALAVDMSGELDVLGFDLRDAKDRPVDGVTPGHAYHLRTYFRVKKRMTTAWQMFVHVDGQSRRHTGDHPPVSPKYPTTSWLPGDLLVDDYELTLPPNFTTGSYQLYFGMYVGETRLKVTTGPSDGVDRIAAGEVRVR